MSHESMLSEIYPVTKIGAERSLTGQQSSGKVGFVGTSRSAERIALSVALALLLCACGSADPGKSSSYPEHTGNLDGSGTGQGGATYSDASGAGGVARATTSGGSVGAASSAVSGRGGATVRTTGSGRTSNAGGKANAGGEANPGGASSLTTNNVSSGTSAVGGSAGTGTSPDSTPGPTGIEPPSTPAYNGLRGESFNADWRFNRGDVTGAQESNFDDSQWKTLDVPHDWSIELAFNSSSPSGSSGGYLDGGIGWYRKAFTLDQASSGKRILIQFDGVYMNSEVWINGTSLGKRPYGYSSFEYDLTEHVKFDGATNVIAVKVNNNQPNSRWYSGSGIYRNVWLTQLHPVHVPQSGVFVSTPKASAETASISLSTDLVNQGKASASVLVTATVLDAAGASVATNDSSTVELASAAASTVRQELTLAAPKLWSLTNPYLYRVKVEIKTEGSVVDTYLSPLGVRTATFSASNGFTLNGENMKLQGVNMHHDLGALGAAVNFRAIERQVEILKPSTSMLGPSATSRTWCFGIAIIRALSCGASATKSTAVPRKSLRS